jgi:hypothetical protein
MRPSAALALAGVALLPAVGCHPRQPPPDLSLDPAQLLIQVQAAQSPLDRVRGDARLRIRSSKGSGTVRQFTAAQRPDRIHLEELDFFGNPVAVLVAAGGRFSFYDARQKVLYRGAATPANLARLVPLPLSAEDLVSILLGTAPLLDGRPVSAVPDDGRLRLRLEATGAAQELWVGAHAAVEKAARTDAGGAGPRSWEVEFFRREERDGALFPGSFTLRSRPGQVDVELTWTEVEVNGALDPRLFEPPAPKGARVVEVGEGGEGT